MSTLRHRETVERTTLIQHVMLMFKAFTQPMSPLSDSFRARQLIMVVALAVHIIDFPLETAFGTSAINSSIEMAVELVFFLDFVLMFNTAYVDKRGQLVSDRRQIARQYITGWFLIDMISSIPVEWIVESRHTSTAQSNFLHFLHFLYDLLGQTPRVCHTIRVIRFVLSLRLDRSEKNVLTWLFYSRYSHLLRIAWVIGTLVVIAHYMACCWKLLDATSGTSSMLDDYISCYYIVLQLLQGQGVPTTSLPQSIFAAVATLIGSLLLAIVFGNVGILVANFNANTTSYQRKMESVFAIMSKLQLPVPLRERIHQYYEHLWREYESLDGEIVAFSKGLSHTLELEVVLFKYMDLIMHVPFWRDGSPDFQKQLMLSLHVRVYLPDDYIIRRGEVGDEFYMLNRGICELVLGPDSLETTTCEPLDEECDGSDSAAGNIRTGRVSEACLTARKDCYDKVQAPVTSARDAGYSEPDQYPQTRILRRGQMFGELALLMNYERTANVRALSYVEMCVLKREDVQKIFVKHPHDRKSVITALLTRVMESNKVHSVPCPLRAMVKDALPVQGHTRLSVMHAALMIAAAIGEHQDDDSIKFGIGPSVQAQLRSILGGSEKNDHASTNNSHVNATMNTDHKNDDSRLRLREAMDRIEKLEATQTQLLQLVQDMHEEVRELRRVCVNAHDARVHPHSNLDSPTPEQSDTSEQLHSQPDRIGLETNSRPRDTPSDHQVNVQNGSVNAKVHASREDSHLVDRNATDALTMASPKPTVVVLPVRPNLRVRRASFQGFGAMSMNLRSQSSMNDLLSSQRDDNPHEDAEQSTRGQEVSPTHRQTQYPRMPPQNQLVRRPSLLSPLRAFLAPEPPPTSSTPYADQLFHGSTS